MLGPAGLPAPDLILPGHRSVEHQLVLDWDDAGRRFVACEGIGPRPPIEITRGAPFDFSTKYRTRIFSVPAGAEIPKDGEALDATGWPVADPPVYEVRSTPASHPLARLVTSARVQEVTVRGIAFEDVVSVRFDARGNELSARPWLPLLLIAAVGAALLVRLDRRRTGLPASDEEQAG